MITKGNDTILRLMSDSLVIYDQALYYQRQRYFETKTQNKIKVLKELLKVNADNLEDFDRWFYNEAMTNAQFKTLKSGDFARFKTMIKKQIKKEKIKLEDKKAKALAKYNEIAQLKDIKRAIIEIEWSSCRRSMGAYQTMATASVEYMNESYKKHITGFTSGCGYDKPSTSFSEVANALLKVVFIKHGKKILNDANAHYNYYAGEHLYYQSAVGLSSYERFFKNLGYKVEVIYHQNENTTYVITKKGVK